MLGYTIRLPVWCYRREQENALLERNHMLMDDITAEFTREELIPMPAEPLRIVPQVKFAVRSEIGLVRENNEDKFDFYEPDEPELLAVRGSAYVVCDGMGGHNAGQIASELAARQFLYTYYHTVGTALECAHQAVLQAHHYVADMARKVPSRKDMGTTLTALILRQDTGMLVHVGDSRCYRLRSDEFQQLSHDHTLVAQWVAEGILTPEMARLHPYKNVIRQAVGVVGENETLEPDIETFPLETGDLYLLCSDGLTDMLTDEVIERILKTEPLTRAAWKLLDRALAEGGQDNITVALIKILGLAEPTSGYNPSG
ncbi:MAG: serine/threonine protein phosphatase [Armatimonadota bacterium]